MVFDGEPSISVPLLEKLIWSRCDLDLWFGLLTLC